MHISKLITGKKSLLIGIAGLIVVIAVLELTNTTHLLHKQKVPAIIPANHTSNAVSAQTPKNNTSSSSSQNAPSPAASPTDLAHTLITPTGTFVSNHYPGRNGSPTSESSSCTTSPSATCYIKFTNLDTGQTTQLPSQVTDARGYTNWYWDVSKDAHLTSGKWKATAVATLGDQVKLTDDATDLVIQ